jgi:hypothetical protein
MEGFFLEKKLQPPESFLERGGGSGFCLDAPQPSPNPEVEAVDGFGVSAGTGGSCEPLADLIDCTEAIDSVLPRSCSSLRWDLSPSCTSSKPAD